MVKKGGEYHPLKIIDISTSEEEEEVADQDIITIETSEEEEEVPDKVEKVMILYGIVLYCMLLNYTLQYCNILLCTVLYSAGGGGDYWHLHLRGGGGGGRPSGGGRGGAGQGGEGGGLHHHPPPEVHIVGREGREEDGCHEDCFFYYK